MESTEECGIKNILSGTMNPRSAQNVKMVL